MEAAAGDVVVEQLQCARYAVRDEALSWLRTIEEAVWSDSQPVLASIEAVEAATLLCR